METPALDSRAQRGLSFDSADTPSPVWVPARSSFITGWEPQSCNCFDFDERSGNVPLLLGAPHSVDSLRSMDAIQKDRDAATLVVRVGPWTPGSTSG